ncbi:MAG TPA: hypothetical protein VF797_06040, partial [Noviherbaspirillum sp.]
RFRQGGENRTSCLTVEATTILTHTAEQKSNPAAGTDFRLVSTAVPPSCVTRQGAGSTVVVALALALALALILVSER